MSEAVHDARTAESSRIQECNEHPDAFGKKQPVRCLPLFMVVHERRRSIFLTIPAYPDARRVTQPRPVAARRTTTRLPRRTGRVSGKGGPETRPRRGYAAASPELWASRASLPEAPFARGPRLLSARAAHSTSERNGPSPLSSSPFPSGATASSP